LKNSYDGIGMVFVLAVLTDYFIKFIVSIPIETDLQLNVFCIKNNVYEKDITL
jgi:hypothetical protein